MISVAVETSTATGSVALFSGQKLLGEQLWSRDGSHSEFLTDSFQRLLKENNLHASSIQKIAVGIGPGSFTGVRVAINFARALAFSTGAKIFCLNSLELLAAQPALQYHAGPVSVVQFAFRDLVYFARFERHPDKRLVHFRPSLAPMAITAESLEGEYGEASLTVGDGPTRLMSRFSENFRTKMQRSQGLRDHPLASDFMQTEFLGPAPTLTDWIHTIPLYIRASEAEEKLKRGLLKPS